MRYRTGRAPSFFAFLARGEPSSGVVLPSGELLMLPASEDVLTRFFAHAGGPTPF